MTTMKPIESCYLTSMSTHSLKRGCLNVICCRRLEAAFPVLITRAQ